MAVAVAGATAAAGGGGGSGEGALWGAVAALHDAAATAVGGLVASTAADVANAAENAAPVPDALEGPLLADPTAPMGAPVGNLHPPGGVVGLAGLLTAGGGASAAASRVALTCLAGLLPPGLRAQVATVAGAGGAPVAVAPDAVAAGAGGGRY